MSLNDDELQSLARFFNLAGGLKSVARQGWVDRGVRDPESVADHSWRLALMTLVVGVRDPDLDLERALLLALLHDLPEALAGDVTPFDDRLRDPQSDPDELFRELPEYSESAEQAKADAEDRAMRELTGTLPDDLRSLVYDAWREYEAGDSPEARLVRQLDKLETWFQALEYRQIQPDLIIESFSYGVERDVQAPELARLLEAMNQLYGSD